MDWVCSAWLDWVWARHSEAKIVVVAGFARTDDVQNHRQGATIARADNNQGESIRVPSMLFMLLRFYKVSFRGPAT